MFNKCLSDSGVYKHEMKVKKSWHCHFSILTDTVRRTEMCIRCFLSARVQIMWCLLAGLWRKNVTTVNENETRGGFPQTLSNQDAGSQTLPLHLNTQKHMRTHIHAHTQGGNKQDQCDCPNLSSTKSLPLSVWHGHILACITTVSKIQH